MAPDPFLKLSPHLRLREVLQTSHREFLVEQFDPPASVLTNLRAHAIDLWEPVRELVGPLSVTSGYRCWPLNSAVKGSATSMHPQGLATDNVPVDMRLFEAMEKVVEALPTLACDQVIFEEGRWIHLGSPQHGSKPRRLALMKFRGDQHYAKWNPQDGRLKAYR